jgi:exopolyphosphatase
MERDDLALRTENLYALALAGLDDPKDQLLTITDLAEIRPFPSQQFILVDHNRINSYFTADNPGAQVLAVVDHHEDEGLYQDTANPRVIAPAGSCASHVAGLCPPEVPAELATLLLTAILIDTGGLKPGGKALTVDYHAAGFISTRSTFAPSLPPKLLTSLQDDPAVKSEALYDAEAIKDLTKTLDTKKSDLSHLGGWDLLRRDYKQYTYTASWAPGAPSLEAGLSTVPAALASWGDDGKLEEAALAWMKHRRIAILGVLTSFRDGSKPGKSGKGKHKREMVWFVRGDPEREGASGSTLGGLDYKELATRLWKGLEDSGEFRVKKHKKFDLEKGGKLPAGTTARVYQQGNVDANRKIAAPLLKSIVEGPAPTTEVTEKK